VVSQFGFVCATSVSSVSLWWLFRETVTTETSEDTEVAQRRVKLGHSKVLSELFNAAAEVYTVTPNPNE